MAGGRRHAIGDALRGLIVLALLFVLARPALAAEPERWAALADTVFQHYTQDQGLPHPIVMALAEDGDGFLWAGTQGGLARWDGYRFRSYKPAPGTAGALPDNYVSTLHVDPRGRLWVGTSAGGLARYDSGPDRFVAYGPGLKRIETVADDGAGGLWVVADGGLDHLDPDTGAVELLQHDAQRPGSLPEGRVTMVLRDHLGGLWVGTTTGLARRAAGGGDFEPIAIPQQHCEGGPMIRSLFEDEDGRIWLGVGKCGAYVVAAGAAAATPLDDTGAGEPALRNAVINTIGSAGPGRVWLGTWGGGIVVVDSATGKQHRIRHDPIVPSSLANDVVWAVLRDRAGSIWVGTIRGLDRYTDDRGAVTTLYGASTRSDGLTASDINAVLPMTNGLIWLGCTTEGGVDIIDPAGARVARLPVDPTQPETALPKGAIYGMKVVGDTVYIGTSLGLYRADPAGQDIHRVAVASQRDPNAGVSTLFADGGILWIGSRTDGVHEIALDGQPIAAPFDNILLSDLRVIAIVPGAAGELWIGTLNGLNRFDKATHSVEQILPDPADPQALAAGFISSLLTDRQGRLWVGTLGGGIQILTGRDAGGTPRFRRLGTEEGLPNANIGKLLQDAQGKIWASTADGLAVIDPDSLAIRALHRVDGVAIPSFWVGSGAVTAAGELLFGGLGGLTVVRPERLSRWEYRPPVVVSEIRIGGKFVPAGPFDGTEAAAPLIVTPDANSLAVEFSALDYTAPEGNRYAYRLEGFDRDWIDSDASRRLASYTNLPPGTYTLHLRGSNRDGVWTEKTFDLPILVLPAWYQSWWFRLVLALAGIAAIVAIVQARTAYLRQRQRVLERQVAERTATIVEKSEQIASLLNNSGEGFLSFGADLVIDPDYSRACESFLGAAPAGRDAADLLFAEDARQADLLRRTVPRALHNADPWQRDLMLSLLPQELSCRDYRLEAQYTAIEQGRIMVVLRDVTETRLLAESVARERRRLEMIVAAVTDSHGFFDTVDAFRAFARSGLRRLLDGPVPPIEEIYRQVHTYKGLLHQLSFDATPRELQLLENRLNELRERGAARSEIAEAVFSIAYEDLLEADLVIIRQALGDAFLDRGDAVSLSAAQARQLKDLVVRLRRGEDLDLAAAEIRRLCDELERLRQTSVGDALRGFDRTVQQVAARLGKEVAPLIVKGGGRVWIDLDIYGAFLRALVHVFRNAVVHGIEDPQQRRASGKVVVGQITCMVETAGEALRIAIADDGAGIDLGALRDRAHELALFPDGPVPDQQLLDVVFLDNVSTEHEVSELAGRGVGLAAVRSEIRALGGDVTVRSTAGRGTEFLFTLPLSPENMFVQGRG